MGSVKITRDLMELVFLRRIARSLEESNKLARQRMEFEIPNLTPKKRKRAVFSIREGEEFAPEDSNPDIA